MSRRVQVRRRERKEDIDTPHGLKPNGFSVLRRGLRHASPKALPKPLYVLCRVVVPMQTCAALRAEMPADGQALLRPRTPQPEQVCLVNAGLTATTLRPAHAALKRQDDEECSPSRVTDALGQVVILHHIGGLQFFVIDRVVGC